MNAFSTEVGAFQAGGFAVISSVVRQAAKRATWTHFALCAGEVHAAAEKALSEDNSEWNVSPQGCLKDHLLLLLLLGFFVVLCRTCCLKFRARGCQPYGAASPWRLIVAPR